jgi:hypothetical protein
MISLAIEIVVCVFLGFAAAGMLLVVFALIGAALNRSALNRGLKLTK